MMLSGLFVLIYAVTFLPGLLPRLDWFVLTQTSAHINIALGLIILLIYLLKNFGGNFGKYVLPVFLFISSSYFYFSLPPNVSPLVLGIKLVTGLVSVLFLLQTVRALKTYKAFNLVQYNFFFVVTLVAYFLSLYDLSNFYWTYASLWTQLFLIFSVFVVTWLLFRQLFNLRGKKDLNVPAYTAVLALIASELALVFSFWMTRYRFFLLKDITKETVISVTPLAMIVFTVVAYLGWGLIYHRVTKSMTRKVLYEYLAVSVFIVFFVLLTTSYQVHL